MGTTNWAQRISALLLVASGCVAAKHNHNHLEAIHKRHQLHREQHRSVPEAGESGISLKEKRGGQCQFPSDAGLVAVAPDQENAGWAMSPDQPCKPGNYCPYACPAGQVSMQWDPSATSYSYPKSMNGGLFCNSDGEIEKPFPDKPYCKDAKAGVGATNKCSDTVSICQTVLPGNEAMLIPTAVDSWTELAIPGMDYWCSTAAHYYINPPGVGCEEACVWGTKDKPVGNWAPYVGGGNQVGNGESFITLGWNPIYLEPATPFKDEMPKFGVKIECDGGGCNGLPCEIDPSSNGVNEITGKGTTGAGGATFCTVTVPKGVKANYVIFDGSGGSGRSGHESSPEEEPEAPPSPSPSPSSSAAKSSASSTSELTSSAGGSSQTSSAQATSSAIYAPHEFYETSASASTVKTTSPSTTEAEAEAQSTQTGAASTTKLSIVSLLMSSLIVVFTMSFPY